MKKILIATILAFTSAASFAAGDVKHPLQVEWPFEGVLGRVDKVSAQRGFQVYKEVCAACHGLKRIAFRNLQAIGFSEAEVKAIAAEYTVTDGPNDDGEMFDRPALPSDRKPGPFANEKAARAANAGAYPPDLSLIVKARHDGANYLYSLLTGYTDAPAGHAIPEGKYFNPYFPGGIISMAPPLAADKVVYQDGTPATVEQMSKDLTNFLQWAAEPEMEQRKQMGIKVLLFLAAFSAFFYVAKLRIWANVK
jgi:ubiquinol-cytochrome c reductase cytochrome c1 subunit